MFGQLGSKHRDILENIQKGKDELSFFIQANISMFTVLWVRISHLNIWEQQ